MSFSNVFAIFVQMLFFPKILFTGSLFQAKVFILFFGFGVSSWGSLISGAGGGSRGPPGGGGGGAPPMGGGGGGAPPGGGGGGGGPPPGGGGGGGGPPIGGGGGGGPPPGGGGGGGAGPVLGAGGGGGGAGAGVDAGGAAGVPAAGEVPPQVQQVFWVSKLCFLYSARSPPSMLFSLWRDLCWLGALSSRSESALDSIRVARWTSVSAVSHIMSLTCIDIDCFDVFGKFVGDAYRLLWVDPKQVLKNGEERDFLRGVDIKNILEQLYQ